MKKSFYLLLSILLLKSVFQQAQCQQYFPVVAKFIQQPPYPVYLSDFSNPSQTNLQVQILMRDKDMASRPIRLRFYVEGQGFQIQSVDKVTGELPITLTMGQNYTIPAQQVANYFQQYNLKVNADQYRRPFNEGTFRFGIEVIDFQTDRPLSGIQWGDPVWIVMNDPPVWIIPQNSTRLQTSNPQNINFQWAPRHKNVNDVEYEFTITDLNVGTEFKGNPQNVFLSQPAYHKVRTRSTTLNYNATMPPLVEGRMYAYRVQAIAKRGAEDVGVFRNNGFSEIQHFTFGEDAIPPFNLAIARQSNEVKFDWTGHKSHASFIVEYREKGSNNDWLKQSVTPAANVAQAQSYFFKDLDPMKSYEVRVQGVTPTNLQLTSNIVELISDELSTLVKVSGVNTDKETYDKKVSDDDADLAKGKKEPTCKDPGVGIENNSSYEPKEGERVLAGNFKFLYGGDSKGVIQWELPFAEKLKLPVKVINVWAELDTSSKGKTEFNAEKQLKAGVLKSTYNAEKLKELNRISDKIKFDTMLDGKIGKQLDSLTEKINTYIGRGQALGKKLVSITDLEANWKNYTNNLDTLNSLYAEKEKLLTKGIEDLKGKINPKKDDKKKDDKKESKKEDKKEEKKSEKKEDKVADTKGTGKKEEAQSAKEAEKPEVAKTEDAKAEKKELNKKQKEEAKKFVEALEVRLKDTKEDKANANKLKVFVDKTGKDINKTVETVQKDASKAIQDNINGLKTAAANSAVQSVTERTSLKFDPKDAYNAGFITEYNDKIKSIFDKKPTYYAFTMLKTIFEQFYNNKIGGLRINLK